MLGISGRTHETLEGRIEAGLCKGRTALVPLLDLLVFKVDPRLIACLLFQSPTADTHRLDGLRVSLGSR